MKKENSRIKIYGIETNNLKVFNTQLNNLAIVLDEPLAGLSGEEKSRFTIISFNYQKDNH